MTNKLEYSVGNMKIGTDTLIINMGSATNCPSKNLGLCNIKSCYALKAERLYPGCLPYRTRQESYWLNTPKEEKANDLKEILSKKRKIKYIRVNESGDFYNSDCVEDLKHMASMNKDFDFYTYTHRSDLEFKNLPENLVVNGSGFMLSNNFMTIPKIAFESKKLAKGEAKCQLNCRNCTLCKVGRGLTIYVPEH